MADIKVDKEAFTRRLKHLYATWEEGSGWGEDKKFSGFVVPVGSSKDELRYLKSISLEVYLFGYELPDTILAFTKDTIQFLGSSKKVALVQQLAEACKAAVGAELVTHVKPKAEDGGDLMDKIIATLRSSGSEPLIGILAKEKPEGKTAQLWQDRLAGSGLPTLDSAAGLANVFAIKDKDEIQNMRRSAFLAASVMRSYAVPTLEGIIDEEKKIKHRKLSEKIEDIVSKPDKINLKLKSDAVDIAYQVIVQSGGKYDLRPSAQSSEDDMQYDVILISLGTRYHMYCANISRTYLVDPNKSQQAQYEALLEAQEAAIDALQPGRPMSDAYAAVVKTLEDKGQKELVEKLTKVVGFGMGLEFRESAFILNAKNEALVKAGMVFNVSLGVSDLHRADADKGMASTYALLVADTVIVPGEGELPAGKEKERILTLSCAKSWTEVAYFFKDDEAEESKPAERRPALADRVPTSNLRSNQDNFKIQEEQRRRQKENQEDLLKKVNDETLRQLTKQKEDGGPSSGGGRKVSEVTSYRSLKDIPQYREMAIQVDQRSESVLLPIYGIMVPFHILTIKNATNNQDGDHSYIRINFNFGPSYEPGARFPNAISLKELSFRSADTRHAAKVVQEIKVLRASVSQRERERAERATLKQQEKLTKAKGRSYVLPDVWIRPPFGGKGRKVTGTLESHANGFRYQNPKGEVLDIMYRNIKHAFFQPAENEMITLVHFRLLDPIMVGKKKTADVQFYTEVMESVQTLEGGRRSMYDPDEVEEEQRERAMRSKINKQFQSWVKRVMTDVWERDSSDLGLEFEIPFRELGFDGVPHRQTGFLMPTVNCLVELIDMPFTAITMSEVNIVNLERVGFNLRNFDMTLVFKDLSRDVVRIDAIDAQSLDTIRDWLSGLDLKFYESKINLNWKPILKSIMEDPEDFIANGGWNFLDQEGGSDEEDAEDLEEGDVEFAPESDAEDEDESEEDSSDESVVDSDEADDSEDYSGEEEEEEEEGLSWDELEEQAKRDDRDKHYDDDDGDDDRGKRKRGGGGSGVVKKRRT